MAGYNKGEWSEVYVFLKLLVEGGIYAADEDLNILKEYFYPLVKIFRDDNGITEYSKKEKLIHIFNESKNFELKIPIEEFWEKTKKLYTEIKTIHKEGKGAFEIPEIQNFIQTIGCTKVKANSGNKTDITVVLHDQLTFQNIEFGFSIKSRLGGASTLLNASSATNFIYKICGDINDKDIKEINLIDGRSKLKDRILAIQNKGYILEFFNTQNPMFFSNLQIIDTSFPLILSEMLLLSYSTESKKITDLTREIITVNPLKIDSSFSQIFYEYKIKNFLCAIALGMFPSTIWSGRILATGGYIIVKEDGDIVCYHIYNRNEFQDYLFKNTKFETPSTSKHNFGLIYQESKAKWIKLNLQIRF